MKAKVFVSYSRKDSAAARKLINVFKEMEYDVWVDWEDIPPATRWMDQIEVGIEKSDAFIFFISPDSIASEVCNVEIDHAAKYNKRIIPIVLRDVPAKETNNNIRQINWIFIRKNSELKAGLERFREAMELDFAWVAEHNKLLEKTLDWHHGKTASLLLRGNELRRVRNVVEEAKSKEPKLTKLQETFLDSSIKNEKRTYFLWGVVATVVTILAGLTFFAIVQRNNATENEKRANQNAILANQQKAIADENANLARKNEKDARNAQLEAEKQRTIADEQRALAEEKARFALAQQSAARAQIYQSQPGELYTSTLLAVASWTTAPSDEANEILRKNISLLPIPLKQIQREGRINSLEFNAQGDLFVTAGADGNTCVWKASDGQMLFCTTSPKSVNDAVFSPNGKFLVIGDESGRVQIIEIESQNVFGTYEAGAVINDVDVRKDNDQIAVTRDDGKITLLEMNGKRKYDLQAFGRLKVASFSPDGKYIASGSNEGNVTLWNLIDGGVPVPSGRHKGEVLSLAFSPDSKYLVTGGMDGYAVAARTLNGLEVYRCLHEDWVTDIAFNSDSLWFATVSNDQRIRLWDTTDGDERLRMSQDSYINEVRISSNGQWIATTGADKTVRVWNASTGTEMFQIPLQSEGTVVGFSGDGKNLIAGEAAGEINVWDISAMPAPENYLQFAGLTGDVQFSPSGDWLAASDGPRVWLLKSNQLSTLNARSLGTLNLTLNGDVSKVAFSPDSVWLGVSTVNGQVQVYNLQTKQPKTLFQTGLGYQIAFTPDSTYLVICSDTGVVEMWSLASYRKTADLAEDGSSTTSVAASPDFIALGMADKIAVFNPDGEQVTEIKDPGDHSLLAFNADGSLLASSNSAGLIQVWKNESGSFSLVDSIRKDSVYSLAFNPSATRLAVGTTNTVYLIDPVIVNEAARIPLAGRVVGISYSVDGEIMATASLKTIQFWNVPDIIDIPSGGLVTAACSRLTANFSKAQWSNLFGGEDYRALCEGLPVP